MRAPSAAPTRRPMLHRRMAATAALATGAAALLAGCGGPTPPVPGENGTMNPEGSSADIGSYSVMAEWEGCPVLDDLAPIEEFMGVTDWGTNGLMSTDIPGGMDGEAFNCTTFSTQLAVYEHHSEVTGDRDFPGTAHIDVGVVPWDSPEEATENFAERVEQLNWALDTGGTDYTNVVDGPFDTAGDWDETYVHSGNSSTGFSISAIARTGDLVLYVFLSHSNDPAVQMDHDPIFPFTDESLSQWLLTDYMPATAADVLDQKAAQTG